MIANFLFYKKSERISVGAYFFNTNSEIAFTTRIGKLLEFLSPNWERYGTSCSHMPKIRRARVAQLEAFLEGGENDRRDQPAYPGTVDA